VPSLDNWQNYPIGSPTSQFYANSPYDVRHRLSVGASFELPGIQLSNSFERRALGGWTVADISILQTGTPFSVFNGGTFQAQLINPNLPATACNLRFAPGSGDYNADGNNNDYPSVTSYQQSHKRGDYRTGRGVFSSCSGAVLPCGNFVLPTIGALGNERPNQFRNPGYANYDFTSRRSPSLRNVSTSSFVSTPSTSSIA